MDTQRQGGTSMDFRQRRRGQYEAYTPPTMLYVAAHVIFLFVGLWAWKRAAAKKLPFASGFWLYIASQLVLLSFFGGMIKMKMAVLLEQTLMVIMVIYIVTRKAGTA
jgi:low temperature requirement protein LtrA